MKGVVRFVLHLSMIAFCLSEDPFGKKRKLGKITSKKIVQASGLAASRKHPSVLYTHNDEAHQNRLFAISTESGKLLAEFQVSNAENVDWEDIAIGRCVADCADKDCSLDNEGEGDYCIYIADTGDDGADLPANTIYMVKEPKEIEDAELELEGKLQFTWPEPEAETLMIDNKAQLYIVSKVQGGDAAMTKIPTEGWSSETPVALDMENSVRLGLGTSNKDPLGGDISPDGKEMVIAAEYGIYYYRIDDGDYLAAFGKGKAKSHILNQYSRKSHTEGICFDKRGFGIYILPAGNRKNLYYYPNEEIDDIF